MIIVDLDFFKTKGLIKENDCSCDESIEFLRKRYGEKDLDAAKIYDEVLENDKIPESWKRDTRFYRSEFNSLKAYVDVYKRSEIIETDVYRVISGIDVYKSGSLEECISEINSLALKEYNVIETPITYVGVKENGSKITYIKYNSLEEVPDNMILQISSYDIIDSVKIKGTSLFEEETNKIKENILNRIKQKYIIQRRYTDETDWFDCWVKV